MLAAAGQPQALQYDLFFAITSISSKSPVPIPDHDWRPAILDSGNGVLGEKSHHHFPGKHCRLYYDQRFPFRLRRPQDLFPRVIGIFLVIFSICLMYMSYDDEPLL